MTFRRNGHIGVWGFIIKRSKNAADAVDDACFTNLKSDLEKFA